MSSRRAGDCRRGVIEICLNEACTIGEAQLACKLTRGLDRRGREIQSHNGRSALYELQAVRAEMALQMQDIPAVNRPKFLFFNSVKATTASTQACQVVAVWAEMHGDLLVPMRAVGRFPRRFAHYHRSSAIESGIYAA